MKENKKQIKAQVVNEVKKRYEQKLKEKDDGISFWMDSYKKREKEFRETKSQNAKLKEENESLKQKLAQYEDWLDRMQEFCNLPEEERKQAFDSYMEGIRKQTKLNEQMSQFTSFLGRYTSLIF